MSETKEEEIIKEYQLTKVKVKDLKEDPDNPNQMTLEQMRGLEKSLYKFGNLVPVIINQNNEIIDGAHRKEVYETLGIEEIPAFIKNTDSDLDRKELRQVMNKLRGSHDLLKDIDELTQILEGGRLEELSELIAQPKDELYELLRKTDAATSDNENSKEFFDRMSKEMEFYHVSFVFKSEDRDHVDTMLKRIKKDYDLRDNASVFLKLCETYDFNNEENSYTN